MRKVRHLSALAAPALLSLVFAGSALSAASFPQAAASPHVTGTPHHKKATPTPVKAKGVHVVRKGVHYTVTWKGTASTWRVTLKVGTHKANAKVKGSVHRRVFTIRKSKGAPHAVVTGVALVKKTAPAKKTPPASQASLVFTGSYSGQASSKVSGDTAAIAANGTGTANLIGAGSIKGSGTADSQQQPCPPFGGTGTITGAKGTIAFTVVKGSNGCGDEGGHHFALVGHLQITKATGALAGVTGELRFTGNYDRDNGTFAIKLTGSLEK